MKARGSPRELGLQPLLRFAQLESISVETKQVAAGRDSPQQLASVAAITKRAVHHRVARLWVERVDYLRNAYRAVGANSCVGGA